MILLQGGSKGIRILCITFFKQITPLCFNQITKIHKKQAHHKKSKHQMTISSINYILILMYY
jgi:hypothetical protein